MMTKMIGRNIRMLVSVAALLATFGAAPPAQAVPSYARQTGQECIACHVSFPELTPYGRYFKLTGYTIGKPALTSHGVNYVPLAIMAQASVANTDAPPPTPTMSVSAAPVAG